ncbi:MAG: UDP-N-acetylmuramoyl-tripeptide--D-alanyl-D-alanine ligase [Schwartzia sp. (in: firmicutes)]
MADFTLEEVMRATGASVEHEAPVHFSSVETDTRRLLPGALFVALRGERFKGETFAADAVQKGAVGVLLCEGTAEETCAALPVPLLRVPDTLVAYQALAHAWRMKFSLPVVAITGSNGKTTTKDLTASVLGAAWPVLKTEANFNNEVGLPLTLLQLTAAHRAAVVEIGMRGLGQIAALAPVAAPSIGVVTNVGETHIELLGTVENIARAKGELVEAIPSGGTVVLNADDPRVAAMVNLCRAGVRVVTFGIEKDAVVRGFDLATAGGSTRFCASFDGGARVAFTLPLAGRHNVYNALAALAVGWVLGVSPDAMRSGLAQAEVTGQRFECYEKSGYTIINDAYNASPASMAAALTTLAETARGRRVAVLGDMLELGAIAREAHRRVGEEAAAAGVALLLTCGVLGQEIAVAARAAGVSEVHACRSHEEAGTLLKEKIQPGDTILFKGSHGMQMDKLIDFI